jgi:hypothetical protein
VETADVVAVAVLLLSLLGAAIVWNARRNRVQPELTATTQRKSGESIESAFPRAPLIPAVAEPGTVEKPVPKKRKPRVVPEITVDTPIGRVSFKKPRKPVGAIIVALGQSEDHLQWFYDVHRRGYLKRATGKYRAYESGKKDRSEWNESYFEFLQDSERQLDSLPEELENALRENRRKIDAGEATVLGTYETVFQAREAARYLTKKREPTEHAGWLNVHVVEIPASTQAKATSP